MTKSGARLAQHAVRTQRYLCSDIRQNNELDIMAPTVVLHLISAGERCFAKSFAEKWQEYGYVPLRVLGMEAAAEVEEQIRARFWKCKSTQTGLMSTAIRLRDMCDPVKKSLSTILEAARADDLDLLELNTAERSLPVYVDFKRKSESDGESRHPHLVDPHTDLPELTSSHGAA